MHTYSILTKNVYETYGQNSQTLCYCVEVDGNTEGIGVVIFVGGQASSRPPGAPWTPLCSVSTVSVRSVFYLAFVRFSQALSVTANLKLALANLPFMFGKQVKTVSLSDNKSSYGLARF